MATTNRIVLLFAGPADTAASILAPNNKPAVIDLLDRTTLSKYVLSFLDIGGLHLRVSRFNMDFRMTNLV